MLYKQLLVIVTFKWFYTYNNHQLILSDENNKDR